MQDSQATKDAPVEINPLVDALNAVVAALKEQTAALRQIAEELRRRL